MSFGEKLAKLRKEKGMSQEELANELNVSRQAVSKWESNNSYPETDKIVAICKLFNCSMDELIGLKEGSIKKENDLFKNVNNCFEAIIKGMKLFYSMTFKQKTKCVIELAFYSLALIVFFVVINQVLLLAITQLLNILPREILGHVLDTLQGILQLVYMIIIIYLVVKLYKARYLDYYTPSEQEVIKEEPKKEKIRINDEKIIIRDSNDDFKPFSFIKNIFLIFLKFITSFVTFGLLVAFVALVACTIFVLYFASHGAIIIYTAFGLIGASLALYVIIEILIKFIFNIEQKFKKLFIIFIASLVVLGISGGLFACEFSTYTLIKNKDLDVLFKEVTLPMQDNMIIEYIDDYDTEIIYENRDDILVEFYSASKNIVDVKTYKYKQRYRYNNSILEFDLQDYYTNYLYDGKSMKEVTNEILDYINKKEIIINSGRVKTKIYISLENYNKILDNISIRDLEYDYDYE